MVESNLVLPQSKFLRKYIKYFLFNTVAHQSAGQFVCFPNLNHCLALVQGAKIEQKEDEIHYLPTAAHYSSYLTGIYSRPLTFRYAAPFAEVCIEFEVLGLEKLLGLNASTFSILPNALEELSPCWTDRFYTAGFSSNDFRQQAKNLEELLVQLIKNETGEFLPFHLLKSNTIQELKSELHLSYRSINRRFKESLGINPKEFLLIKRFRKAIDSMVQGLPHSRVADECTYADQSHLIREFKKYTQTTPTNFFKTAHCIANQVWVRNQSTR